MAIPAARDPGPLVTLVRNRTVANVDSIGFVVRKWDPVLGRVPVELQEHVGVVDDLGDRLGVLRAVIYLEGLDRDLGLVDVLGVVDFPHRRGRTWMSRLGQRSKHIGLLVKPAALFTGIRKHLPQCLPEPQRPITDGQHRGGHPAASA